MNTQNLRTLFPTVTKQKILNLSYGEGEHYTVLPMIAQKEDTFYLWEISAMSEQEYEHRNRTYKEAKTNRAELKQNLEEADQVWIEKIVSGGCCFEAASATGTCLGERYNIEEQIQFLYMLGQGAELGELEQVELDRLFITCYELTGKDGQELSEEACYCYAVGTAPFCSGTKKIPLKDRGICKTQSAPSDRRGRKQCLYSWHPFP